MEPITDASPYVNSNQASLNPVTEKFKAAVTVNTLSNLARYTLRRNTPFNPVYFIRLAWIMGNKGALEKAVREFRILRQKTSIEHLQEELEAYKSLETLNDELKNELRYEFTGYFGRMIEIASPNERERVIQSYIEYGVESISLEGCEIYDVSEVIAKIGKISSLKHLNLCRLNLRGVDLGQLPKSLESLILSFCELENDDLLHLPNLEELILYGNGKITDKALDFLPKSLKVLSLCQCVGIMGSGLKYLGSSLEALFLDGCSHVSDKDIAEIPKSVKVLSLSECDLTDEGMKCIPREVEELTLWQCRHITDRGIAFLPATIQQLNIAHTLIEGIGFSRLPKNLKEMHHSIESFRIINELSQFNRTIKMFFIG